MTETIREQNLHSAVKWSLISPPSLPPSLLPPSFPPSLFSSLLPSLSFFQSEANLTSLRNIIGSYVWMHADMGYSQGMCDLVAPLLVVMGDEAATYSCYLQLMESAIKLFPPNLAMNTHLANLQSLLQVCYIQQHRSAIYCILDMSMISLCIM